MVRPHILLVGLLLAGPASAQPAVAPGTPYAQARESLLREGWSPLLVPDADRCGRGDARCAGRPEMVACAGTGAANCLFAWQRQGTQIEVITAGDPAIVTGTRPRR
ncbi:hypothetical protein GXW74_22070 [Roseomonas eburnea]|uniref:Uncharacterized protein n=1 Tax=Neoroseomonas eburnea TaxID=1346889 RepID=A0A9X9XHK6_9PROT|nr:hypothetical protein [Neoroseomonas eburnea]MBR0683192.1 hypothetical protein [Neoroseomonas eburnea]